MIRPQNASDPYAPRIVRMRDRILAGRESENIRRRKQAAARRAESIRASQAEGLSRQRCRAREIRDVMTSWDFQLDEHEPLVGRPIHPQISAEQEHAGWEFLESLPPHWGQTGHCELDLQPVMSAGVDGVARTIAERRDEAAPGSDERDTLESFLEALDGLTAACENAASACERQACHAEPDRRAELGEMAGICRHVAHQPPRTMREALQLQWMIWLGVSWADGAGCIAPGHLDRWLWPFYRDDLAAGRITRDEALFLIESLYLLTNACWPEGSAISTMVGGRDAEGNDVFNDLSILSLEALRRTRLIYPTVGICHHEGTPAELVDLAVGLIAEGCPNPAFFNDEVIQAGLRRYGVPAEEACCYMNSMCVEITPSGSSGIWVASPYYPLPTILNEEIEAQVAAERPADSFDAFLDACFARLARRVREGAEGVNEARRLRQANGRHPLQSVFTRDCIARGRDVDDGGPRYNWAECSFVGLANLVDALHVIRHEVFQTGRLSLAELWDALRADWVDHEPLRQRIATHLSKYGQDDPAVDELAGRVTEELVVMCRPIKIEPDDSPYVPGLFCWIQHERLGQQCGATADGRKATAAFADGAGPAQGRESSGPTAGIASTTSWDHSPMLGGIAYNMEFNGALLKQSKARDALGDLILTFLRRGGFEVQVNVVDADTLRDAREHPEVYRDLVVRIGGYTDYFTRQNPGMQEEIIRRTEFESI